MSNANDSPIFIIKPINEVVSAIDEAENKKAAQLYTLYTTEPKDLSLSELYEAIEKVTHHEAKCSRERITALYDEALRRYQADENINIFALLLMTDINEITYGYCTKAIDIALAEKGPCLDDSAFLWLFEAMYYTLVYGDKQNLNWVPADMELFWERNDMYTEDMRERIGEDDDETMVPHIMQEVVIQRLIKQNLSA